MPIDPLRRKPLLPPPQPAGQPNHSAVSDGAVVAYLARWASYYLSSNTVPPATLKQVATEGKDFLSPAEVGLLIPDNELASQDRIKDFLKKNMDHLVVPDADDVLEELVEHLRQTRPLHCSLVQQITKPEFLALSRAPVILYLDVLVSCKSCEATPCKHIVACLKALHKKLPNQDTHQARPQPSHHQAQHVTQPGHQQVQEMTPDDNIEVATFIANFALDMVVHYDKSKRTLKEWWISSANQITGVDRAHLEAFLRDHYPGMDARTFRPSVDYWKCLCWIAYQVIRGLTDHYSQANPNMMGLNKQALEAVVAVLSMGDGTVAKKALLVKWLSMLSLVPSADLLHNLSESAAEEAVQKVVEDLVTILKDRTAPNVRAVVEVHRQLTPNDRILFSELAKHHVLHKLLIEMIERNITDSDRIAKQCQLQRFFATSKGERVISEKQLKKFVDDFYKSFTRKAALQHAKHRIFGSH